MNQSDIEKYRELIESDLAWRLDEIAFFQNQLNAFKATNTTENEKNRVEQDKKRFRKLLILVLYAHFEGFFKYAFTMYVEAINEAKIELSKAIDILTVSSLQKVFLDYEETKEQTKQDSSDFNKTEKRIKQRIKLLDELEKLRASSFIKLPISTNHLDKTSIIYTESNLSPEVVEKILARLGLDASAFGLKDEELKKILNEFLKRRHGIAHGDGRFKEGVEEKQWNEYKTAFDKVVNLIPSAIYNALVQKLYLKPPFRK